MHERKSATNLPVLERPSHPVCAAGSFAIHERIAWMTRMSARRVTTASPPGRMSCASTAIKRSVLWIDSSSGELQASP